MTRGLVVALVVAFGATFCALLGGVAVLVAVLAGASDAVLTWLAVVLAGCAILVAAGFTAAYLLDRAAGFTHEDGDRPDGPH